MLEIMREISDEAVKNISIPSVVTIAATFRIQRYGFVTLEVHSRS